MTKIAVIAKLTAQPGKRDELLAAAADLVTFANTSEPGTEVYTAHAALDDEDTVWFYELYSDDAAFMAHSTSEAMQAFLGAIGGLLGAAPDLYRLDPRLGSGLDGG